MNVRYVLAVAVSAVLLAAIGTASAQMAGNAGTSAGAQPMPQNFVRMQQMMTQAHAAGTWAERMRLMQSHMQLMQQQMGSMMGMMGMSMKPGQGMNGGMMNGSGGQRMGGKMMGGNAGDLQAQMAAMQARMREMARMMQQMLEQQQLLLQKASGEKGGG